MDKTERVQYFVVAIHSVDIIEKKVVSNYVDAAIRKYDKLCAKLTNQPRYFDGIYSKIRFSVKELNLPEETKDPNELIRQTVTVVKEIKNTIRKASDEIDNPNSWVSEAFKREN